MSATTNTSSSTHSAVGPGVTAAVSGFRWIELLEKEFDKSFVAMDEVLRNYAEDYEVANELDQQRKLLANMGHCFVQSIHKAQTIFQANAKQEAELLHLREELAEARASVDKVDAEKQYLVCRLQSALLENHKLKTNEPFDEDSVCQGIQLKLAKEMAVIKRIDLEARRLEEKCFQLEKENAGLRRLQVELESELVGARLDSKYLDKELAGRVQQIQILLANGTSQEHKQKVWAQIESEMHLQRSKTISNMCFSKQKVRETAAQRQMNQAAKYSSHQGNLGSIEEHNTINVERGKIKQVHIHKSDSEEMGMAILGGVEHGLPIMISEVFPDTAVGRCKKICAGDVILAVNGDSFENIGHHEAVKYLSSLRGTIKLDLQSNLDQEISDVCDMDSRYYNMFPEGPEDERTVSKRLMTHPGRAKEIQRSNSQSSSTTTTTNEKEALPEVHSSPRKSKKDSMIGKAEH